MHGVKRTASTVPDETKRAQEDQEQQDIAEYRMLVDGLLALRRQPPPSLPAAELLECSTKLLLLNPDFATAWNARRTALVELMAATTDGEAQLIREELEFGVTAIRTNPKSYGAWYHRKWLIQLLSRRTDAFDVTHELKLCDKLLELDSRNFHCWNYRWFLTETFNVSVQAEFDFTTLTIYRNFSNYSAWHRRSLLFPRLEAVIGQDALRTAIDSGIVPLRAIRVLTLVDLRLIKSAYFTEPADQSCWFYLRWLLDFAGRRFGGAQELIKQELDNISELLSVEPEAPLALATWIDLAGLTDLPRDEIREKARTLQREDSLRAGMYDAILTTTLAACQHEPGSNVR